MILFNPTALLVFSPWLLFLMLMQRAAWKRAALYSCIVLAIAFLTIFPWMLRNQRQLGGLVIRTSLGLTLYASNNDCAGISLMEDMEDGCFASNQPNNNVPEAQLVRDMGELRYDQKRLADAKAWMRSHPRRFAWLTLARFRDFWFPRRVEHPLRIGVLWLATLLSIPGLALMSYRRRPVTLFVLCVLAGFPLMYYAIFSDVRFRYPILWLTLLPAGYFLQWLAQRPVLKPVLDRFQSLAASRQANSF